MKAGVEMKKSQKRHEIILAGTGGQGLVLAGILLGEAAILEGRNVAQTQSYGVASRGGLSLAEVIMDRDEIIFQQVQNPDIILALTQEALDKFRPEAQKGVPILFDTTLAKAEDGASLSGHPFTRIASDLGNTSAVNMLALGALCAATGVVDIQSLARVIEKRFKAKADLSLQALYRGMELVRGA